MDLTQHSPRELELQVDNDQHLYREWRLSMRTGNLNYIKSALALRNFTYTKEQYEHLVDLFEEDQKRRYLEHQY